MIQITRSLARQLRIVFKKAAGRAKPDLHFLAGPEGLRVRAQSYEQAVEFHAREACEPAELRLPFRVLEDIQGSKAEPVHLLPVTDKIVTARWSQEGVERRMEYSVPKSLAEFPAAPAAWTENQSSLLNALATATGVTDSGSTRYALGCLQLQGQRGKINATDGRHLLSQAGFQFGFEEDVLCRSNGVFGCGELPSNVPIQIGKTDHHVAVRVGPWTMYLSVHKEGRFPRVDDNIPATYSADSTLTLDPADAKFLLEHAQRLPLDAVYQTVTLEFASEITIRAKTESSQPVEIVLRNSSKTGPDGFVCSNMSYLCRMARIGLRQLYFYGDDKPVLAQDEGRSYVWMPLDGKCFVPAGSDCLRLESPVGTPVKSRRSRSIPPSTIPMTTPNPTTSVSASPASPRPARPRRAAKTGSIAQAIELREQLRQTGSNLKELIRSLKQEARSRKSLQSALKSLKELQAA